VLAHLAVLRTGMTAKERSACDERVLAISAVLELVEQRQKRRLSQRTLAGRMGVSQPMIARLEKPLASTWPQPSLRVLSRYAATLSLVLEVRLRPRPDPMARHPTCLAMTSTRQAVSSLSDHRIPLRSD
jgi:transcriptional regulator with XRE-family HTH domain